MGKLGKACLIFNPAAGRGRLRAAILQIRAAFAARGITESYETGAPGDEETFARRALDRGVESIVAVGGDGTCSRIAGAIVAAGSDCSLTVLPSGTGNDFAKTLGLSKSSPADVAELVARNAATPIDVGKADGHCFLNSCGFGFDASVLEASNSVRLLKGDAVYIYSALLQLFGYHAQHVSAAGIPGAPHGPMLMVTASNGKSLGGAFRIAPRASVTDGKLDICFFADSSVLTRARLFAGALRGTHLDRPEVFAAATTRVSLSFESPPAMEMDGELRVARGRTVELQCAPRALRVIAAPGALS